MDLQYQAVMVTCKAYLQYLTVTLLLLLVCATNETMAAKFHLPDWLHDAIQPELCLEYAAVTALS